MQKYIGYARVSSTSQNLDTQLDRLDEEGCTKIFEEKYTGITAERTGLKSLLDYVREGDTIIITKLDRLARSVRDLGNIASHLESKSVNLKVLDQPIDTSTPSGKLMFNMIGAFAEFERDIIRERCQEGIDRAKAQGKRFGRKPKLSEQELQDMVHEFKQNKITRHELAQKYGISKPSLYRLVSEAKNIAIGL